MPRVTERCLAGAGTLVGAPWVPMNLCCANCLLVANKTGRHFARVPRCKSQSSARLDKNGPVRGLAHADASNLGERIQLVRAADNQPHSRVPDMEAFLVVAAVEDPT